MSQLLRQIGLWVTTPHYRRLARLHGKRIYLVHIRKTGGTSLNHMFLALAGGNPAAHYENLARRWDNRFEQNGLVYAGWNRRILNQGNYFYGFSHIPIHKLTLPTGTFVFTCLRDPAARVLSHYAMLLDYARNQISHPVMAIEGAWLGDSLDDFLDRAPNEHLLNQLYMFSPTFNVDEAERRIRDLDHFLLTEDFLAGVKELNRKAGLALKPMHVRRSAYQQSIPEPSLRRLRALLAPEYQLLTQLKSPGR